MYDDAHDTDAAEGAPTEAAPGAPTTPPPAPTVHDTADSIPAPSAASGESGEPGEASAGIPSRACPCSAPLPCPNRVFCRGVCRTAYRKLSDAGLPIGEDGRAASNASRALAEAARRLSSASPERMDALAGKMRPDARERLREALERASGRRG